MTFEELEELVLQMKTKFEKFAHLESLLDVQLNDVTENDLLIYGSDGKWHNLNIKNIKFDIPSSPKKLSDLSDVVINNLTDGSHLTYDVLIGKWTNTTLKDSEDETDLSNYLTKSEAAKLYFPFTGGTITGPTTVKSYLHTTGNITSEAAVTAKTATI